MVPTISMSGVRTHFWMLVARGNGAGTSPRKYGLNGTIPALTSSSVGSSAIREADGTTVCPRSPKKEERPLGPVLLGGGWARSGGSGAAGRPGLGGPRAGQLALGAVVGGPVVVAADDDVGRVLLGGHAVRLVVGVLVAVAVPELLGPGVVRVAQVGRDRADPARAYVGPRGARSAP